jgi:ribonuclease HII
MLDLKTEKNLFLKGKKLVAGLDEVGRGPLAGPVVAACVVIGPDFSLDSEDLEMVKDSKALSAKKRQELFKIIKEKADAVEIGIVDSEVIDKINILQASFLAMRRALKKCSLTPHYLLVDGRFKLPKVNIEQTAIIGGDNKVWSIAAASIIAKVSRDYIMEQYEEKYPGYGFLKHKGYGTKAHIQSITDLGPCPIHRRSFAPIKKTTTKKKGAFNKAPHRH